VASNTCGSSIGAGLSCTVAVTFVPIAIGMRTGTLAINNSAAGSPTLVPLSGTGNDTGLTSITVTPASPTVPVGNTLQFIATGNLKNSSTEDLTPFVAWSSSNTSVATIAPGGLATGVTSGTSSISAKMGGTTGSTTLTVNTGSTAPPTPTGLSPGGSSLPGPTVTTLTPTLTWNASTGATAYSVSVSQVGGGNVCAMNVTTNSAVCPSFTNGASYLWAVSASNAAGSSPTSAVVYFTVAKFYIGEYVKVSGTGGVGLNLRSCASTACSVLVNMPDGTVMQVIGGPTVAGGYTWWDLSGTVAGVGYTGWSIQDYLVAD
jgi:Bacterial Ig-like domain (group 2)